MNMLYINRSINTSTDRSVRFFVCPPKKGGSENHQKSHPKITTLPLQSPPSPHVPMALVAAGRRRSRWSQRVTISTPSGPAGD